MPRCLALIASLVLLPALAACGATDGAPPPPSDEALKAIVEEPGADRVALARAADRLFTEDALGETRALIVMYQGEIVAERYAEGYKRNTRFLGWSMAKSLTAVAIGILVSEGRLKLDESPPIPRWQRSGDPRGEITLRQLLQMRSGLRHAEMTDNQYDASTVRMLFLDGRDDMADWAEAQPLAAEPGRRFMYSTVSSVVLSDIIARVLAPGRKPDERRHAVSDFLQFRLFEPAGLHSMVPEFDAAGTLIGGSMISATARDWARFGELLRHGGSVKGVPLVPRRWIDFMRAPSPRADDYGAQLWLNRKTESGRHMLFAERGPASLFAAIGHDGQYLLVSPEQQLTVLRIGKSSEEERPALVDALADIVSLY